MFVVLHWDSSVSSRSALLVAAQMLSNAKGIRGDPGSQTDKSGALRARDLAFRDSMLFVV